MAYLNRNLAYITKYVIYVNFAIINLRMATTNVQLPTYYFLHQCKYLLSVIVEFYIISRYLLANSIGGCIKVISHVLLRLSNALDNEQLTP